MRTKRHCWAGEFDTDGLEFGSAEYIEVAVAREIAGMEGRTGGTCMLQIGHAGPHQYGKVAVRFAQTVFHTKPQDGVTTTPK